MEFFYLPKLEFGVFIYLKLFQNMSAMTSMSILFCVNLLNYMDRYTIAGVLTNIQSFYEISDSQGGLLQTVFIIFFMVCSPAAGYLGDRYNRKWIMIAGIGIWIAAVFASTFVPKDEFWLFLLFRGIVGVGEASYAIVSPTIIADLFTGRNRSRMLMFFYFAIPCGSGLGFIVSSFVAALTGQWAWGVRITAIFGVICLVMIIIFVKEPERGAAERNKGEIAVDVVTTSYWDDIKSLITTPTYVLATLGYTAMVFVVGVLTYWGPTAIVHSTAHHLGLNSTQLLEPETKAQINLIFGIITCVGGIVGVTVGSSASMASSAFWKGTIQDASDKSVRSYCMRYRCSAKHACLVLCSSYDIDKLDTMLLECAFQAMIFLTIIAMCFNWAANVDMLMAVIIPSRRNAATSWQILISHLFGDASGPYLVGIVSSTLKLSN
ncbi:transporter, major facilitator family protein [Oesophagostomum dentatum]|uniref:Transporter, major facilitator family protein n=1 Tax=Oesophagostomum dentatum TaxID=61180 RepID=A0A0B1SBJ8_OESDE|nr:transporter, major facilitator family protein [Oesophagostomum dentatum]